MVHKFERIFWIAEIEIVKNKELQRSCNQTVQGSGYSVVYHTYNSQQDINAQKGSKDRSCRADFLLSKKLRLLKMEKPAKWCPLLLHTKQLWGEFRHPMDFQFRGSQWSYKLCCILPSTYINSFQTFWGHNIHFEVCRMGLKWGRKCQNPIK